MSEVECSPSPVGARPPRFRRALLAFFVAIAALPAAPQQQQEIDKLRTQIDQLQRTVDELQRRLTELEADKKAAAVPQAPAPAPSPSPVPPPVPDYNGIADLQNAAPRADNVPLDPKLKGFIAIPGTSSIFKLGGSARVDGIWDAGDNGNPNWFNPSSMPVEGQPGYNGGTRSSLHAKGTRFNIDFRRPLGKDDQLRIFYENDFFDDSTSTTMKFRVRHFYGQASNLLIGQTYSGFEDIDAWPDVVDYLGPNAIVNRRQAQIRYTRPLSRMWADRRSLYVSAEMPSTDVDLAAFPAGTREINRVPDFVAGYRVERKSGHMQLALLARTLTVELPGDRDQSTNSLAFSLSGARKLFEGDKLSYQLVYGNGVARYLNDTNGLGLDAAPAGDGIDAVTILAPVLAYGHAWNDRWRSTISYSYVRVDVPATVSGSTLDNGSDARLNLVFQPTAHFRLGIEYLHGTKETASGAKGSADRLNLVVKYDLVK